MKEILLDVFHLRESMKTYSIEEILEEIKSKIKKSSLEEREIVLKKLNSIEAQMKAIENKTFDRQEFIERKEKQFNFLRERIKNNLDSIEVNYKKISFILFSNTRILNISSIREAKELLYENKELKKEIKETISFLLNDSKGPFYKLENTNTSIDQEFIDDLKEKEQKVILQDQLMPSFLSNEKINNGEASTSTIDTQIRNEFNDVFDEPQRAFKKRLSYVEKVNLDQIPPFIIDDQDIITEFNIISNEPSKDFEKRLSYVSKMDVEQISSFANQNPFYKEEDKTSLYNEGLTNDQKEAIITSNESYRPYLGRLEGLVQKLFQNTVNPLPLKIEEKKENKRLFKGPKKGL